MEYLHHHYKPNSKIELLRMQQRGKAYQVIGDELYKTSVTGPLLRCIGKAEDKKLLAKIHLGVCRGHICSRTLATLSHAKHAKVFTQLLGTILGTPTYDTFMAATEMGHRYGGTFDNRT
jgi:hypothetical protein